MRAIAMVALIAFALPARAGDRDRDGIDDTADHCPDAAEDRDGFQDADGCPDADNDGDGILDATDACPNAAGSAAERGCPGGAPAAPTAAMTPPATTPPATAGPAVTPLDEPEARRLVEEAAAAFPKPERLAEAAPCAPGQDSHEIVTSPKSATETRTRYCGRILQKNSRFATVADGTARTWWRGGQLHEIRRFGAEGRNVGDNFQWGWEGSPQLLTRFDAATGNVLLRVHWHREGKPHSVSVRRADGSEAELEWAPDGTIKTQRTRVNGKREGPCIETDASSGERQVGTCRADRPDGPVTVWRGSQRVAEGAYFAGQRTGLWTHYDAAGRKTLETSWLMGRAEGDQTRWSYDGGKAVKRVCPLQHGRPWGRCAESEGQRRTGTVCVLGNHDSEFWSEADPKRGDRRECLEGQSLATACRAVCDKMLPCAAQAAGQTATPQMAEQCASSCAGKLKDLSPNAGADLVRAIKCLGQTDCRLVMHCMQPGR